MDFERTPPVESIQMYLEAVRRRKLEIWRSRAHSAMALPFWSRDIYFMSYNEKVSEIGVGIGVWRTHVGCVGGGGRGGHDCGDGGGRESVREV